MYTGKWLQNARPEPGAAVVHVADTAHDERGESVGAYADQAPPLTEVGPVGAYPGSEWVVRTLGEVIEREPVTHDPGDDHATDRGADDRGSYNPGPLRFHDEKYMGFRWTGSERPTINPAVFQRGMNANPENNPDGFPLGHHEQHVIERKFAVGERVHDRRIVTPNTAYENATGSPPVPTPAGNPFSSQARAIRDVFQRPQIRREPQPVAADLETDPAPYAASEYTGVGSWVVG